MSRTRVVLSCLVSLGASVSLFATQPRSWQQAVKHPPEVIEAYRVCETFQHLMSEDLDFAKAFEATFATNKTRRRAIAIAGGEFGSLDYAKLDDDSLIKAYKLQMQIFFLMLPLSGPSDEEVLVFFPPAIKEIMDRKGPAEVRDFSAYLSQLERDATRFRAHLNQIAASDKTVAERIRKFKSETLGGKFVPPDYKVESAMSTYTKGVLGPDEPYYQVGDYMVIKEQGQMRIVGIRFFSGF